MTWIHRAACKDIADPDRFFPVARPGAPLLTAELAEATTICQRCPVRTECLADALAHGEEYGVWGGQGEHERDRTLRQSGTGAHVRARSRKPRKPADLPAAIVTELLTRLDAAEGVTTVSRRFELTERVVRETWRAHRDSPNPPRQRVSMSQTAIAQRAGHSRYGRAPGGNRPVATAGVSA